MFGFGRKKRAVEVVWLSETGAVREENQDAVFRDESAGVYGVADGMGGGSEGGKASAAVCAAVKAALVSAAADFAERMDAVAAALRAANARILAYARERGFKVMGSTAAFVVFDPNDRARAAVCHAGDSRVYRIRAARAEVLTRDHTVGCELGDAEPDARALGVEDRAHPFSHVLTRAVGIEEAFVAEWRRIDVAPGDRFVICSDGVHDVVSATRLAELVGESPLAAARDALAAEVVAHGSPDNYSFLVLGAGGGK